MKILQAILIFLLFFLAVTFSLQNVEDVSISFKGLISSFTAPLFTVVLAAVFLGVIIGAVGGMLSNIRLRVELRRKTKEAERMRRELETSKGEASPEPDLPSSPAISD